MTRGLYEQVQGVNRAIRPLEYADLSAVMDVERQCYSFPWSEGVFRDCFRPEYRLWALDAGEQLAGYAVVAYMFDEAHLLNLCIRPSFRRDGAARLLLRHLLTEAVRDRMHRVILEVRVSNEPAMALYQNEGFSVIGRRPGYYPDTLGREDAMVMALALQLDDGDSAGGSAG